METQIALPGRRRRVVARAVAIVTLLAALGSTTTPAQAQECGCRDTGPYRAPAVTEPAQQELSPGAGTYRLTTSGTASSTTLRIERADNGTLVKAFTIPNNRINFGFSPDGDRFYVSHGLFDAHIDEVVLYDLAANRQVYVNNVTSGQSVAFSPHGRWFLVNVLRSPTSSETTIIDSVTGQVALYAPMEFETIPGEPGDRFGVMRAGFSPDAADRSYVWAYRQRGGAIELSLRNLATRTTVLTRPVGGSSFWRFSPCGDTLGLSNQTTQHDVEASIYRTAVPLGLLGTRTFAPIPANIRFESTLDHHRVVTTDAAGRQTVTPVGSNDADTTCPPPLALDRLAVEPGNVVGGERNAVGTIRLSVPAPSSFVVNLSSSDPAAATVPSSVTVLSGSQSRTFAVTSRPVTSAKTVTIRATAQGVTRTATLTVEPAPVPVGPAVESVSVDVPRPLGGATVTGRIALTGPAGPGGTTVLLQSSVPAVASAPPTVTVAADQSTATFPVTTTTVTGDSPVVISATAGGTTRSVRITVLTADRTCQRSLADAATETLKARSFAAYDDAGDNVDCGAVAEFRNGITVGAGNTGLEPGTPVQLVLALRLHGALHSSPPLATGGTRSDGNVSYTIVDDHSSGEGGEVASFSAQFSLQQYAFDPNSLNVYWDAATNLSTNVGESQSSTDYLETASPDGIGGAKDTGRLTAVYSTTVGAHLTISARLSTVSSAYGPGASAVADFSNTFGAMTFPAPGFEGLALTYDVGGEPANRAPVCIDGSATVEEGGVLSASLACTDLDGDPLAYDAVDGPASGQLSPIGSDGAFTYTPASGFHGTDSFSVAVTDGRGGSALTTFAVTVQARPATLPASKDDCKDGGWRRYSNPTFKNQGDCVSWVNHQR